MLRERARARCRDELHLLAESTLDVDSLRLEAIAELRRAIGFDLWCSPLVDPDSLIPHRPVVYTVQDHLTSVFAKLGVRSRRELVTGMFGQAT